MTAEAPEAALVKRVSGWKALVGAGLALVAAGAVLGGRYALAEDFDEVKVKVERHDAVLEYIHGDLEDIRGALGLPASRHAR